MKRLPRRLHSESGAVFIHVALAMVVLLMFLAMVADYGMLMVARNQAQNAADAGALAGAHSIAFDGAMPGDRWDRARNVAWNAGHLNPVWGDEPGVVPISPYGLGTNITLCKDLPQACIRVDVHRDGTNGSATMATWFAQLFGKMNQSTRAMAVAQAAPASGTNCLKPWLIPDRFVDNTGTPNAFDPGMDTYIRPTMNEDGSMNYGTGYTPADIGTVLTLHAGNPQDAIAPGNFYAIDDPEFGITGGDDHRDAIGTCRIIRAIGDVISIKDGRMPGPTSQGFADLLAESGEATIIIGMFDPADYADNDRQSGNQPIQIVNMLAFHVDENSYNPSDGSITGTIVGAPSTMATACETWPCPTSTGLVSIIRLVR